MTRLLLVLLLFGQITIAGDTLFTHPMYPPIVYEGGEYNFFKYNPKFIPENLLHAFKMLGTHDTVVLDRFKSRSLYEVIDRGIFDRGYRVRREFCLYSYSTFTQYFHSLGIYSPFAMETYILLGFHQYLNQVEITWNTNKELALENLKLENKSWKKRAHKLRRIYKKHRRKSEKVLEQIDATEEDFFFQMGDQSWQLEKERKLKRKVKN